MNAKQLASRWRELYDACCDEGFNDIEALELVASHIKRNIIVHEADGTDDTEDLPPPFPFFDN